MMYSLPFTIFYNCGEYCAGLKFKQMGLRCYSDNNKGGKCYDINLGKF